MGEWSPPIFGNGRFAIGDTPDVYRIPQPWDVIQVFSTDARVSLAVSSARGRATQPYVVGLGNSLRTPAGQEQLFTDVESWKPRLIVAYLPDWTPGVSELAPELVRRQRAGGREILLRYPLHTSMPLPSSHVDGSGWTGCRHPSRDDSILVGGYDDRLGWSIECARREANVCEADGRSGDDIKYPSRVHIADRTSEPTLTPMGISFDHTRLDPSDHQALTPGIKSSRESWTSHQ